MQNFARENRPVSYKFRLIFADFSPEIADLVPALPLVPTALLAASVRAVNLPPARVRRRIDINSIGC